MPQNSLLGVATQPALTWATQDYSQNIGTSAVNIITKVPSGSKYLRLWNVSASGGGTIWLTRNSSIGLSVSANLAGCFSLQPGEYEIFIVPQPIPINGIWAIATAAGTPLTVEIG